MKYLCVPWILEVLMAISTGNGFFCYVNRMTKHTNTEVARVAPTWNLQMWGVVLIWSSTVQEWVTLHCGEKENPWSRLLCIYLCTCQANLIIFSAYFIHFEDSWSPFMNLDDRNMVFLPFFHWGVFIVVVLMINTAPCDDSESGKRWR